MSTVTRRALVRTGGAAAAALLLGRTAGAAPLTREEEQQIAAVRLFASGWKENDPDKVVRPYADNCSVRWTAQKVELPPVVGKENFLRNVRNALGNQTIDMLITEMFALGPVVVNCHHQLFESKKDASKQEDLYVGVYFFENGKIREWIDYAVFDPQPRKPRAKGFDRFTSVS